MAKRNWNLLTIRDLNDEESYELRACLENNYVGYSFDKVDAVLAYVEGQNDGAPFHWVLKMKDGTYSYLHGGCDYTGWDCQSWATAHDSPTPAGAVEVYENLDHTGDYDYSAEIIKDIKEQLLVGRPAASWRVKRAEELR